jgi:hypothetical protein
MNDSDVFSHAGRFRPLELAVAVAEVAVAEAVAEVAVAAVSGFRTYA